jgi:hypothetical protein
MHKLIGDWGGTRNLGGQFFVHLFVAKGNWCRIMVDFPADEGIFRSFEAEKWRFSTYGPILCRFSVCGGDF